MLTAEQVAKAIGLNRLLPDPPGGFDMQGIADDLNKLLAAPAPSSPNQASEPPERCDYHSEVSVTWNARCLLPKGHSEAHAISVDPHDDNSEKAISVNRAIKRTCPGCGGTQYRASQWGHAAKWLCKDCRREDELT